MRVFNYTFLFVILAVAQFSCKKEAVITPPGPVELTEAQKTMVAQLNKTVHPITSTDPTSASDDLQALDYLGNVRIVGMGEATHGTKEFFQMKDRIFRYLVEQHGFRTFVFEMDFAESLFFNDYIQNRSPLSLEYLMGNRMIFWTWRTEEVYELLKWMRAYNDNVIDGQLLSFFGVDCQYTTYNADVLVEKVRLYDESFADSLWSKLYDYRSLTFGHYEGQTPGNDPLEDDVNYVYQQVLDKEEAITDALGVAEYTIIRQLALSIVQTRQTLYSYAFETGFNNRDRFMADNVNWIVDYLGSNSKIAIWAHNNHVADFPFYDAMGRYLKAEWGEDYQIIGFGFSTGYFSAVSQNQGLTINRITELPPVNSANFLFHYADAANFILKFDELTLGSEMARFFTEDHPFLSIGAVYNNDPGSYYRSIPLAYQYDAMIYFDETMAAVQF